MLPRGVLFILGTLAGCGHPQEEKPSVEAPPRRPDILLVTIDTLRADRVGAYGDPLAETPNLDRLAAQGVLFRDAVAVAPLTLPSHASILTGLLPIHHGLRDNGGFRLGDGVVTLATHLKGAGYRTGAFVSAYVLDKSWGLDQGFDTYRSPFHPKEVAEARAFGDLESPSADTVNAALAFLRKTDETTPSFCWVHLYDPHAPWKPHTGWEGDPYRGEVSFADSMLGKLLGGVRIDDLVIVTSDHGEGLWEHGEREHGVLLYRATTRVPLVIRVPGGSVAESTPPAAKAASRTPVSRPKGQDPLLDIRPVPDAPKAARVVETPVSGVDLAATMADYAGISYVSDGFSLRPALEGAAQARPPVYAETFFPRFHYGWSELALVQEGSRRLRVGPRVETYDLTTDPGEERPREAVGDPLAEIARRGMGDGIPAPGPMPAEVLEKLQALGYVTPSGDAGDAPRQVLPDPRDKVEILARLHVLEGLDPRIGILGLRKLILEEPELVEAHLALAVALHLSGDDPAALNETLLVLERRPEHTMALSNVVALLRNLKRPDEAIVWAQRIQRINPRDPRGYRLEIALRVDLEEPQEVIRLAPISLGIAPDDPFVNYLYGLALLQLGRFDEAVQALESAQVNGSVARDIPLFVGQAHEKAGRVDKALASYQAYTRSRPEDLRGFAAAGHLLYKQQRCREAMLYLKNVVGRGVRDDPMVAEAWTACSK